MHGFTSVGSCPKCGAPIWSPDNWTDTNNPPPARYSCACPRPTSSGANESTGNKGAKVLVG